MFFVIEFLNFFKLIEEAKPKQSTEKVEPKGPGNF